MELVRGMYYGYVSNGFWFNRKSASLWSRLRRIENGPTTRSHARNDALARGIPRSRLIGQLAIGFGRTPCRPGPDPRRIFMKVGTNAVFLCGGEGFDAASTPDACQRRAPRLPPEFVGASFRNSFRPGGYRGPGPVRLYMDGQ